MHWIWLTVTLAAVALAAVVALRYGADSRNGDDRNPFAPRGAPAPGVPSAPTGGYRRAHTPADDLAVLSRAARAALDRIRRRRPLTPAAGSPTGRPHRGRPG